MRMLTIDEAAKTEIASVIEYAKENRYSKPFMIERVNNKTLPAPGDMNGYSCRLHDGFKCVYTIEEQPFGWCHHLSVSVNDPSKLPSVPATQMLMKEFGILIPLDLCQYWIEEDITPKAVNILAPIENKND